MEPRRQLLLAVGIVEWAQALTQLHLLGEYGTDWQRTVDELHDLIVQWPTETVNPYAVVREAHTYLTERIDQLDNLLGT